jgi:CheY-like chemotaxis protein
MDSTRTDAAVERTWNELRSQGKEQYSGFEQLIKYRVRKILLVASLYDSFTLEEGGRLTEVLLSEYRELNLSSAPRIIRATTADEALELIKDGEYDLVITMTRVGDMSAAVFAKEVKAVNGLLPVIVLGYNTRELVTLIEDSEQSIDNVFIWTGDVSLLLTIIKHIEDLWNVDDDTRHGDVRVVLLVEDSVRFYSAYLPLVYTEIMRQTHDLMADSVNLAQKLLRMRARPKILLARDFESALAICERYRSCLIGVITDGRFPRDGKLQGDAGVELIRRLREDDPALPIALQSSEIENKVLAARIDATFLYKQSPRLLKDFRSFLREQFGFGDFVFRTPDGEEVGRAHNTRSLIREMSRVPDESLLYHAHHDHFSNWLRARTRFALANTLKPLKAESFESPSELRAFLVETLAHHRYESQQGIIADFSRQNFDATSGFTRIGTGSIGGKARGLAFMNHVINRYDVRDLYPGVNLHVPPTAVVATDVYDEFLDQDDLRERAIHAETDEDVVQAFLEAKLPPSVYDDLRYFLESIRYPLAVRSSSLLEDAQHQPFAGVYRTYMIQNNHSDLATRLDQLCDAIKLVYASTFYRSARSYLAATDNLIEEEKMAVIIQKVVGSQHEQVVYPNFAGVAHSTNHYPSVRLKPEDGVVQVSLGLGRVVVEGGQCLRFSPRQPEYLMQFATIDDTLRSSQTRFQAVDTSDPGRYPTPNEEDSVVWLDLADAERHGTLHAVGSTYSAENERIDDGIARPGPRVVTFAHVLKYDLFPLAEILCYLLEIGRRCLSSAVEMEFAVDLHEGESFAEFGLLQIRPLMGDQNSPDLEEDLLTGGDVVIATEVALGNGRYDNIHDIVFVPPELFDRGATEAIAQEVAQLNQTLRQEQRPYLLIGPGRWGSSDRWLGIPVDWSSISGAAVIVETDLEDFKVTPSQGSHFFQNLTSFQVGYLTVNQSSGGGVLDWDWLDSQSVATNTRYLRHIQMANPVSVLIDGRSSRGVVLRP